VKGAELVTKTADDRETCIDALDYETALMSFMETITPGSHSPQADPASLGSFKELFDDPEGDTILCSCEYQSFRVLKLYIVRSSIVLGDLIRAASESSGGDANIANGNEPLPVVQLSDRSTILSSLFTFIFPVSPILPSTLEETMELLSVAQKYEMSSVLTHIRGAIALQNPPFIHPENALVAYSLAQSLRLRKEVIQAARLTLKFTLTIESLEYDDRAIPSAYLYELWNYNRRVRAHLSSDLRPLVGAKLNGTLNVLKCAQENWVKSYVLSIMESPSLFDPIEFKWPWHGIRTKITQGTHGVGLTLRPVCARPVPQYRQRRCAPSGQP